MRPPEDQNDQVDAGRKAFAALALTSIVRTLLAAEERKQKADGRMDKPDLGNQASA